MGKKGQRAKSAVRPSGVSLSDKYELSSPQVHTSVVHHINCQHVPLMFENQKVALVVFIWDFYKIFIL